MNMKNQLSWLQEHRHLLNISEIARLLGIKRGELHKALREWKSPKGCVTKIPNRCAEDLQKIIDSFK